MSLSVLNVLTVITIVSALTMVYDKANSMLTETLEAQEWIHKHIIGRKGENIRKITGANPKVCVFVRCNCMQKYIGNKKNK